MDSDFIARLHAKARRCRELAAAATDKEAAESLLRLAAEIEAALPILEDNRSLLQRVSQDEIDAQPAEFHAAFRKT